MMWKIFTRVQNSSIVCGKTDMYIGSEVISRAAHAADLYAQNSHLPKKTSDRWLFVVQP